MARDVHIEEDDPLFAPKCKNIASVLKKSALVDANFLSFLWPSELRGVRLMVVSFERISKQKIAPTQGAKSDDLFRFESIPVYTPKDGPFDEKGRWIGKDVILKLQREHFTLLVPDRSKSILTSYPIDDIVNSIEAWNHWLATTDNFTKERTIPLAKIAV
jgi:hypothetical protein